MRKIIVGMVLLFVGAMSVFAQNKNITVSGRVIETDTKDPVEQATIRLLSLPDSTYVTGGVTQTKGRFALPKVKPGKYVLVISYIGLRTKNIPLQLSASNLTKNVGVVALNTDAIQLKEAVITAEAPQVTVSEDTLVFNSSAYRVPQGAMLEELVKKLPGAEVADDGTITINGKTIKKIMLNGKEFFSQDTKVAMKNLPVEMIDKVKSYDKKSDLARITGIDDGDEETVIDLTVKKGMNQGWFGNLDLGAGDQERYLGKMMLNRFSDGDQLSLVANANNINDQGFPGGGGFRKGGSSNNGINAMKTTGINFAHDTNKLELGGNVDYSHTDKDIKTSSLSESFLQNGSSFSKELSSQMNKSESLSADFRMEWKPDSLTNIIFRPSLSYSSTNNNSNTRSLVSDSDVLSGYDLNTFDFEDTPDDTILVNSSIKESGTRTKALSTDGNLQINRKLNKKGRNITLRLTYGYSDDDSDQSSDSKIRYHRFENDSAYISNQFINNKNNSYNYKIQTTYSEPIFTNRFLQFSYSYQYKYQETDKKTYDYTDKENYLNNPIASLSKYYENKYNTHEFNLSFKTVREKYQYNIGFSVQPQQSTTSYLASAVDTTITRNVVNLSPTFDYRYRFNKQSQLRINYRGKTSQPSMTDLSPITDESDPLNITEGNPSLKPSYSNNFMLFYNAFLPETQQSMMLRLSFTNTSNSVSNMVTYNEQTGGKTTRPENINGNWSTNGGFVFNTPLNNKKFAISTFSDGSYNNMVSYTSLTNADAVKNTTRSLSLSERLNGTFRNDWFDFGLNSGIQYNVSRNSLQAQANKETFDYSFGASTNITLPWSMSLATDVSYSMRNGYSSGLDRNELIWNAQVAKNFLKQKQATISFQIYDILKEQSNLSRSISASMRQDTEYNAINSYFMVHFIYRLNAFGGNKGKGDMDRRGGPDGPPRGMGGRGGFGGDRPF
jgi:hypothetical protein